MHCVFVSDFSLCDRVPWLQILKALKASHSTGIVHRDIKPQNVIISETDSKAKLIDLGAAADLRVGINYVPNEYLLDPRYAPPQQYIMSTSTPRAPPVPVAATLSPILWRLNDPDRFDMYSVGVSLFQMVFAPLRNDNALVRQFHTDCSPYYITSWCMQRNISFKQSFWPAQRVEFPSKLTDNKLFFVNTLYWLSEGLGAFLFHLQVSMLFPLHSYHYNIISTRQQHCIGLVDSGRI